LDVIVVSVTERDFPAMVSAPRPMLAPEKVLPEPLPVRRNNNN